MPVNIRNADQRIPVRTTVTVLSLNFSQAGTQRVTPSCSIFAYSPPDGGAPSSTLKTFLAPHPEPIVRWIAWTSPIFFSLSITFASAEILRLMPLLLSAQRGCFFTVYSLGKGQPRAAITDAMSSAGGAARVLPANASSLPARLPKASFQL